MFRRIFGRNWLNRQGQKKRTRKARREQQQHEFRRDLRVESLEDRRLLTTNIDFAGNVLTVNIGAANETSTLVVAGTNLSIQTTDVGGITLSGAAAGLGFTVQGANTNSTGSIAAGSDVRRIDITGAAGTQSLVLQGGAFTAMNVNDGLVENVTFNTAVSTFNIIAGAAPNANLNINAATALTFTTGFTTNNGGNATLQSAGAIDLNATTVGGNLAVTAIGITDSAAVSVTGTTNLTAGAGNNITLDNANNFGGDVTITSGNNVTLNDTGPISFGGNSTISGTLNVTSNGLISDGAAGVLNVTGTATFAGAANNITLDNVGVHDFSTVIFTSGNNITIVDLTALNIGTSNVTGSLAVTAGGAVDFTGAGASMVGGTLGVTTPAGGINDSGAGSLAVTGVATLAAGPANNITLNNANNFSTVVITTGNDVTLTDTNGINIGNSAVTGNLTVNAGGLVDFTGAGASTVGGTLGITTTAGGINDSGAGSLAVTGTSTLAAGAANNITLDNAGNDFSTVGITSGNIAILRDTNAINLAAMTLANNLGVTAGGNITDSGTLNVTGAAAFTTLNNGGASIVLDFAGHTLGLVSAQTRNVANAANVDSTIDIRENAAMSIGLIQTGSGAGIVNLQANGAVTSAAVDGTPDVTGRDLTVQAVGGIGGGTIATALEINVTNLDAANSAGGSIFILDTAGGLTLRNNPTFSGADGNAVTGVGGGGEIRAASPLTIAANAITTGGMTYTAADSAAVGDDLTVNGGVTVQDTTGALTFNAGDNMIITGGVGPANISAFGILTFNGDTGGAIDAAGSTMNLRGNLASTNANNIQVNGNVNADIINIDTGVAAPTVENILNNLTVTAGAGGDTLTLIDRGDLTPDNVDINSTTANVIAGLVDANPRTITFDGTLENLLIQHSNNAGPAAGDIVTVRPHAATQISLDGQTPATGSIPGDTISLDLQPAIANAVVSVVPSKVGAVSNFSGTGVANVNWVNFETLSTDGLYNLQVRMDLSNNATLALAGIPAGQGFADDAGGLADRTELSMNGATSMLLSVTQDPLGAPAAFPQMQIVQNGTTQGANSLEVVGSDDNDILQLAETVNGLPSFPGAVPGAGVSGTAHTNAGFTNSGLTNTDASQNINLHFAGGTPGPGASIDSLQIVYLAAEGNPNLTGYFPDAAAAANSGVVHLSSDTAVQGMTMSFAGLAPIDTTGAGAADTLIVDASALPGLTFMNMDDDINTPAPFNANFGVSPFGAAVANNGRTAIWGDGGLETTRFENYGIVTLRSGTGVETIDVAGIDAGNANPITTLTMDADNNTNTDISADVLIIRTLPATVTATMLGGQGNDGFLLSSNGNAFPGTVNNILGQVFVSPAPADDPGAADMDTLAVVDDLAVTNKTVQVTSTTIEGITGFAGAPDITYAQIGTAAHGLGNVRIFGGQGNDTYNVQSTIVNTNYDLITDPQPLLVLPQGDDTVNISSTAPAVNGNGTLSGDLNGIAGALFVNTLGNATAAGDRMNVSDFGGAAGRVFGLSLVGPQTRLTATGVANIDYDSSNALVLPNNQLEHFSLVGSDALAANNTYNINHTTATQTNRVSDGDQSTAGAGNDATFNITGDTLSAANTFQGFDGNDQFVLNIAAHIGQTASTPVTSVLIEGQANPTPGSNDRDSLTINDNFGGFVRNLNYTYLLGAGDIDVGTLAAGAGLFGGNAGGAQPLNVRTMETMIFNGDAANNDLVRVTGTANDDDLTVALRNNNTSALVFINGNPYTFAPGVAPGGDSLAQNLPGHAGLMGRTGPDIRMEGIAGATGITLDGAGVSAVGNRAIVQTASENPVLTPGGIADVNIFGFGPGVLIPGFLPGNAYDLIGINGAAGADPGIPGGVASGANQVVTRNISVGLLIPVTVLPGSFVNGVAPASRPGLIVNAGDEVAARAGGVADNIFATSHPQFNIAVNGNLPPMGPLDPNGFPAGDQLNLVSPTSFSIWSDKMTPPNVNIIAGNGPFGVVNSSIERTRLVPGNGIVNLIGDNNTPGVNQTDNFVVTGLDIDPGGSPDAGVQEMAVVINGSSPILIEGVQRLNTYGYDLASSGQNLDNPSPNAPDNAPGNDVDTLEVIPFADNAGGPGNNAPRGWGVQVLFNEGSPVGMDAGQVDLLIVHTSTIGSPTGVFVGGGIAHGGGVVSENISIQPSGPDNGEVRVTNAVDGSIIMVASYIANTDIVVIDNDGSVSDTDTLTLNGMNPDPANPTSGHELIIADFTQNGDAANPVVTVSDSIGGTILYRLRTNPAAAGAVPLTFDTININGQGGNDTISVIGRNDGTLGVNVEGGSGNDTLALPGSLGGDTFAVTPGAVSGSGVASVQRAAPAVAPTNINFSSISGVAIDGGMGAGADTVTVNGTGGNDVFTVVGTAALQGSVQVGSGPVISYANLGLAAAADVTLNGLGGNDTVNVSGLDNVADTINYTATAADSAQIDVSNDGGATFLNYLVAGMEHVSVNGLEGAGNPTDVFNVTNTQANVTPTSAEAGTVQPFAALPAGLALLGVSYSNMEDINAAVAANIVVLGTEGNDTIVVTAAGLVTVTDALGNVSNYDAAAANSLVINGLGGDDSITINGAALFAGGIRVIGGDNGNGSDDLTVVGTAGNDVIAVDLSTSNVTGVVGGPINFTGIENLTVNANGAAAGDAINVTQFGAVSGLERLFLNANALAGDTISVIGTAGDDTIAFNPTDANSGVITRDGTATEIRYANFTTPASALTVNGGAGGTDVLRVLGTAGNDTITTTAADATRVGRVTFGAGLDRLDLIGGDGNDTITAAGLLIATFPLGVEIHGGLGNDIINASGTIGLFATIYGGAGDDNINGTDTPGGGAGTPPGEPTVPATVFADFIDGGEGDDVIIPGVGNDIAYGGAGNDVLVWDPGDSSDRFEGGDGDSDVMRFNGAGAAEIFTFNAIGSRLQFLRNLGTINMDVADIEQVDLNSLGGTDTITVNDVSTTSVRLINLNLGADGAVDGTTVNSSTTNESLSITSSAAGSVAIGGLSYAINMSGVDATDTLTVDGQVGNDTLDASSLAAGRVVLTLNGNVGSDWLIGGVGNETLNGGDGDDILDPGAGTNTVNGDAGADTLRIRGTNGSDTGATAISVTHTAGQIAVANIFVATNAIATLENVLVEAGDGSDTIDLNLLAAGGLNYTVLGGNPVGAVGDRLNVSSPVAVSVAAGPENDAGSVSAATVVATSISYDEIEALGITLTGAGATILGTNGDDDITVVGTGANAATVTVNDGAPIFLAGLVSLAIDGLNGDDDIDIDNNTLALGAGNFTVTGGLPSANADVITFTGAAPSWTPTSTQNGQMVVDGQRIDVSNAERVIYDGESGNVTLQVNGPAAAATRFVHTPGNAADAGRIDITDIGMDQRGLGIEYQDLGLQGIVQFNGSAGIDVLVALGTSSNDDIRIEDNAGQDAQVDLRSAWGNHVNLVTSVANAIEQLIVDGLDGDDTFAVNMTGITGSFTSGLELRGGNPSASDSATVTGTAAADTITLTLDAAGDTVAGVVGGTTTLIGIENLTVNSLAGNDTLAVNDFGDWSDLVSATFNSGGDATDTMAVTGTANPDDIQVTPTSATRVESTANGRGPQLITNLAAGVGSTYTVSGGASDDKVTVHGSVANDTIAVARAATTTVTVGAFKQVDLSEASPNTLTVDAGDGDDTINVTGTGGPALTVRGGDPTNAAGNLGDRVSITMAAGATTVSPGATPDAGTVTGPAAGDRVDFFGLEFVILTAPAAAGDTLTIQGTHDNDTIAAQNNGANRVWVNDRAVVEFTNYDTLTLQGRFGDDVISVTPGDPDGAGVGGPLGVTTINVVGGDPTASDTLIVNGTLGDDQSVVTPTGADAGTVDIDGVGAVAPVIATTVEHITINGLGGDDDLSVVTTAGEDTVTLTPGATIDSGSVQVNSLVPMSFINLGGAATLAINDAAGGANDTLVYNGTAASDTFQVPSGIAALGATSVRLNNQIGVGTNAINIYTLRGMGGDDTFNITPQAALLINVEGDEPGASDTLNYTAQAAGAVDLNFGTSTISQVGFGNVVYSGVETVNLDATNNATTLTSTGNDDVLDFTPYTNNTGRAQINGVDPVVFYSNIANNTITHTVSAGRDTVVVNGNADDETIDVNTIAVGQVQASMQTIVHGLTAADALVVNGGAGNDVFNVTAALYPISINGGDPVGSAPGDTLNIAAGAAAVTANMGPESDSGSFIVGANAPISFDEIESASVTGTGAGGVTVNATNADNDITVTGTGTDDFTVSVDGGPAVQYTNFATANIDGLAGDDDFDIAIAALTTTALTITGGSPSTDADRVTITGTGGADAATYTPTGVDTGTFDTAGLVTAIALNGVESVVYDGEGGDETLTVIGAAGTGDRFIHTPTAADGGDIEISNGADTLLGISYVNLGLGATALVSFNGLGGIDTLVARGTDGNDTFTVATATGNVTLTSLHGTHVPLSPTTVETLTLDGLDGADTFNIPGGHGYTTINLWGSNPSAGSDVANVTGDGATAVTGTLGTVPASSIDAVVTGGGLGTVNLSGVETLNLDAGAAAMSLVTTTVDDILSVTPLTAAGGRAQANGASPVVNYTAAGTFTVDLGTGNDRLIVNGSTGDDVVTATATLVTVAGRKPITYSNGNLENLEVQGWAGSDRLDVDNSGGLVELTGDVFFDGGVGDDTLRLMGATAVTASTYNIGPDAGSGSSVHSTAAATQRVVFTNLEPVIDIVAGPLTVNATDANNAISYRVGPNSGGALVAAATSGQVSIDGFEDIEFANKTTLTINGHAGDDVITLNNGGTPTNLTGITVQGDVVGTNLSSGDRLIVNDLVAGGTLTVTHTANNAGTVVGAEPVTVTYGTLDALTAVSNAAGDLAVAGSQNYTVNPGAETDQGTVLSAVGVPVTFDGYGNGENLDLSAPAAGGSVTVNGTGEDDNFTVATNNVAIAGRLTIRPTVANLPTLSLNGLDGDDIFAVNGNNTFTTMNVAGGGPDDGDSLLLTNNAGAATIDLGLFTVTGYGALINYSGLDYINADANAQALTVVATADDDTTVVTPFGGNAGRIQNNGWDPLVDYANVGNNTVTINSGTGDDRVVVNGTAQSEAIRVDMAAAVPFINTGAFGGIVNLTVGATEAVAVNGLEGNDNFTVTTNATIPVFIDGGDPIGTSPGDSITVDGMGVGAVAWEPGPESDEGGFKVAGTNRVSYDHIEALAVINATCALVVGTNADDEITVIARDASTHPNPPFPAPGADGIQDFTTSVNGAPEVLWLNVPSLYVDGVNGDDDITIRTPAPNAAVWNTNVFVAGGPASTPEVGDRLRVETPYQSNTARYQPTGPDSGVLTILAGANTISTIKIGQFLFDCNPAIAADDYLSSPGGVEQLIYDGVSAEGSFNGMGNQVAATPFTDNLVVIGDGFAVPAAPSDDRFIHTPTGAPDAGRVDVVNTTNNQTMLAINYNNLGLTATVTVDGVAGNDTLVALGTDGSDRMDVAFTAANAIDVDLASAQGTHVDLLSLATENFEIRSLDGDDVVNLNAPAAASWTTLSVHGGGPGSGSDTFNVVSGAGNETITVRPDATLPHDQDVVLSLSGTVDVSGYELLTLLGQAGDTETVSVELGGGDNAARVERGSNFSGTASDLITSDSLVDIQVANADILTIVGQGGSDIVTFRTWFLAGGANTSYRFDGGSTDTLVIEGLDGGSAAPGVPGNDSWTVRNPVQGVFPVDPPVQVTDNNAAGGATVTVTAVNAGLGRLVLNTLGGDDTVLVDVGATDVVPTPITFDGGANSDRLTISGTPATAVDEVIYSPGPATVEGRLAYENAANARLMTIDFLNLEPVVDLVPALHLTVNGTNADNAINYTRGSVDANGFVSVDAYETIEFSGKTNLNLNGLAGSDTINLNNGVTPTALTTINVAGGDATADSDTLIVNGRLNLDDAIGFTPTPATDNAGQVTIATLPTVNFTTTESLVINGQRGDGAGNEDILTVNTPAATSSTIEVTPGSTVDAGTVQVDSLVPMSFTNLGAAGQLLINDPGVVENDTLIYNGTAASDVFTVPHGVVAAPSIALNNQVGVGSTNVETYRLRGLGGDDVFNITPQANLRIDVQGDEPSGSDLVNFFVNNAVAAPRNIAVELDNTTTPSPSDQSIQQQTLGLVTLLGVETLNIEAADNAEVDNLVIAGTRFDDVITYTALTANDGTVTSDRENVTINFNNFEFNRAAAEDTFTITGGTGGFNDQVIVRGSNGRDLIQVDAPNRTVIPAVLPFAFPSGPGTASPQTDWRAVVLNSGAAVPFGTAGNIESVTIQGRDGDDTIQVVPAAAVGQGLFVHVDGGSPQASDALVVTNLNANGTVAPLAATDFVVVGKSRVPDAGNVIVYQAAVRRPGISYANVEVVSPNVPRTNTATDDANLLILGADLYEENEFRVTAAYLGSGETINVENLAIFPNQNEHPGVPADFDYFRVVALTNGTLDFQVYFKAFDPALLPQGGNLDIDVLDARGNVIAGFGVNNGGAGVEINDEFGRDSNERVRIPAVAGQTYYLRVYGTNADVVNGYDFTVTNVAPPVPYDIELDDLPADPTYDCNAAQPSGLNSDTGRSQFDNITCDNTPTIILRLDDNILLKDIQGNDGTTITNNPPDQRIPIPFQGATVAPGYRIAIFDEGQPQQPGVVPEIPIGFVTAADKIADGVYRFTFPVALTDGSHFISARVQMVDPSTPTQTGFGARSQSLEIIVDTTDPQQYFGVTASATDGLHPDSDSGVDGPGPATALEITYSDRITNDTTPTFYGLAEADTVVRMYLDINQNNAVDAGDVFLGQVTSMPFDGSNQFGSPAFKPDGSVAIGGWEITSTVHMNDPEATTLAGATIALPFDGLRRILVTAEDVAGNVSAAQSLDIFVDTQGPQVTNVFITAQPGFDLFDPKDPNGYLLPTPLINSLSIPVQDFPNRIAAFPYEALERRGDNGQPALDPGHYELRGDASGIIPIQSIAFVADPGMNPARGTIVLNFTEFLPDDRFTLTVKDSIVDTAGNALDGENNAQEPQENPNFPTGDGQPGGDFVARFTVDSRPEVGVWAAGNVWVDTNGNRTFDPDNLDFVNRDIVYAFGYGSGAPDGFAFTTDDIFAGNFSGPGPDGIFNTADDRAAAAGNAVADGFDKLAAYGGVGFGVSGKFRWLIDFDNDGVPDVNTEEPMKFNGLPINGIPVAGNFDGFAANGDEVGIMTGTGQWWLDTNHDYRVDTLVLSPIIGHPIVGDFDGDGRDDLGSWTDDSFRFDLAANGFGQQDATINFGFIGARERPVASDMDMDGVTDIGLWVPDRNGQAPEESGEWYFLISNDYGAVRRVTGTVNTLNHPFEPIPFAKDLYIQYGDSFGIGIVGNFDPPVTGVGTAGEDSVDFTNPYDADDVNGDTHVAPGDVLILVNAMNDRSGSADPAAQTGKLFGMTTGPNYIDTNGDTYLSPADILKVINRLNSATAGEGESGYDLADAAPLATAQVTDLLPASATDLLQPFSSLVIADTQVDAFSGAAGQFQTIDVDSGSPASAQDEAMSDLFDGQVTDESDDADAIDAYEALLGAIDMEDVDASLLDDVTAARNEEDSDQAILDLFG